jgi:RNA recognition motif-containing protein
VVVKKGKGASSVPDNVDVGAANGSKTVFMKNLPWSASDDDIYTFFDGLPIYQVRLAIDHDGRPKGFGHVEFETVEAAAAAIAKSGEYIGDRDVYIETTTERQQRTSFMFVRAVSALLAGVPFCFAVGPQSLPVPPNPPNPAYSLWWKFERVLPRALLFCVGYRAASGDPIGI